jgi:hypothetical protein
LRLRLLLRLRLWPRLLSVFWSTCHRAGFFTSLRRLWLTLWNNFPPRLLLPRSCNTFALRLLLSDLPWCAFGLRLRYPYCAFSPLLIALHLPLFLFHMTCFTLRLDTLLLRLNRWLRPLLFLPPLRLLHLNRRLLHLNRSLRSLRRTASLSLVTHFELLVLRAIWRGTHTHLPR